MAQDANQGTVGISMRESMLRMTEAVLSNGEYRITKISQGRVRTPFLFSSFKDAALIRKYAEDINRLYETADFQAQKAIFTLDSNLVLIKKIPVDGSLREQRLKDHVYWEAEQCLINSLDDYIIDFEHAAQAGDQEYADVILVIVRRSVVDFLRGIFKNTDLQLRAIDVDVFAAQRAFVFNYEPEGEVHIALIDVRKDNVQISIVRNGEFFLSQDLEYPLDEHGDSNGPDEGYRARIVSKELRRILLDNKLGKSVEDMHAIYVYGEGVTDGLMAALHNTHKVRIERANPFRRIKLADQSGDPSLQEHSEAFVVSVGAALKTFK